MQKARAVLFDFGDTLFGRAGAHRAIVEAAAGLGVEVDETTARNLWAEIQARARTPEELAKGRDLSPEAHRACWTALYSRLDVVVAGLGAALYEREIDPLGWEPFPDAGATLVALRTAGVPVGVVSDTGWDIRPVFAAHGLATSSAPSPCPASTAWPSRRRDCSRRPVTGSEWRPPRR